MTAESPTISILCVNYNGADQISEFLESVKKLNYKRRKIQLIVIDNHSQDNSVKNILTFKNVRLIRLNKNYGYGPAINIGLKYATGNYVLIANNDLILDKNCLNVLINYSQNHPQVAIIGGKIFSKRGKNKTTSAYQTFDYLTGAVKMNLHRINKPTDVQWVQGCAMFIPMEKLEAIGPFDSGFEKIYFEDLDLCRRAQLAGFRTMVIPDAIFYHYQSYTMDNIVDKKTKWFNWHKNKIRFAFKHASLFQITTILIFEAMASIFQTLFKNQPQIEPFVNALIENFKNFNEIKEKRVKLYG